VTVGTSQCTDLVAEALAKAEAKPAAKTTTTATTTKTEVIATEMKENEEKAIPMTAALQEKEGKQDAGQEASKNSGKPDQLAILQAR
jgi:hypothetical protein